MERYHVYGVGNALVDIEFRVSAEDLAALHVDKGVMTLVEQGHQAQMMRSLHRQQIYRSAGGSAANTVIALSQLGGCGFYSCKVADDELGRLYTEDLRANGVATNAHECSGPGDTGRCLVLVTDDAERTMCTYLGITGDLGREEIVPEALRASDWLYVEGYLASSASARAAIGHARAIARDAGVGIALSLSDPNVVRLFGDGLREMIADGVDLLFSNEQEALEISGSRTLGDAITTIRGIARRFVVTRGPDPTLVFDGSHLMEIPSQPITPVDTTGAGDMFAGAFFYGLSQGWDIAESARLANRSAAHLITTYGPRLDVESMRRILREHTGGDVSRAIGEAE